MVPCSSSPEKTAWFLSKLAACWSLFPAAYQCPLYATKCVWKNVAGKLGDKLCFDFYFISKYILSGLCYMEICFLWASTDLFSRNCSTLSSSLNLNFFHCYMQKCTVQSCFKPLWPERKATLDSHGIWGPSSLLVRLSGEECLGRWAVTTFQPPQFSFGYRLNH